MIVDDHAETRRALREMLVPLVTEVCECASGEDALEHAAWFKPDWVTMDYQMGGMSGIEAIRALRVVLPGALMVVVSANDSPALRLGAQLVRADGWFLKDKLPDLRCFLAAQLEKGGTQNA